jgi:hypothetical protein
MSHPSDHLAHGVPIDGPIHRDPSGFLGPDSINSACLMLDTAVAELSAAGVELAAYDRRILDWIKNNDQPTVAVVASLLVRAVRAGKPSDLHQVTLQVRPPIDAEEEDRLRDVVAKLFTTEQMELREENEKLRTTLRSLIADQFYRQVDDDRPNGWVAHLDDSEMERLSKILEVQW